MSEYVSGSLFEEDYLIRTLGPLAYRADIAITELVANAWDSGASRVDITIPDEGGQQLIIEDDGTGLTREEFHQRWMKLGYNRQKYQGYAVVFPPGRQGSRIPYGKNGVGRHGLLCFNDHYKVITRKGGKETVFSINTREGTNPFVLQDETAPIDKIGHGTRLEVFVKRNRPNPNNILDVISARFLHDPQFVVYINKKSVPLEDHQGLLDGTTLQISENIKLDVLFIDTQKAARSTIYQGIAFWQSKRLVGEPSWILGKNSILDGRTKFAKRYTFVAKTDDLGEFVTKDWTGFLEHEEMNAVYEKLTKYIHGAFRKLAKNQIDETKVAIKKEFKEEYSELSPLGKFEVDEVIEYVVDKHPTINHESIGIAVEAVIRLEKTRSGKELLYKLSQLSNDDISGLNRLLDQWTIKDALSVLDEIDRRISVIEVIDKLSGDPKVNELSVLHPLVTEARWLFGPEFDSAEYTSNRQLRTIAKKIFSVDDASFENEKKRPDLFVVADYSVSLTAAEQFNTDTQLVENRSVLLIELKRGGASISRENFHQANDYITDFIKCPELSNKPVIHGFVVGHNVDWNVSRSQKVEETGVLHVTTFSQLVDTAQRRLFNLRDKLTNRYDGVNGIALSQQLRLFDESTLAIHYRS